MGGYDPRLRAALCTEMLDMPLRGISGTLRVSEVVFVDLDEGERARSVTGMTRTPEDSHGVTRNWVDVWALRLVSVCCGLPPS